MTCAICVEPVPPSRRFTCPYCSHFACKPCVQRYLLEREQADCMACHCRFDRGLLLERLSRTFVDGALKRSRERFLFDRETAMLPATQPHVTQELQRRENMTQLLELRKERFAMRKKLREVERACADLEQQLVPPLDDNRRAFVHRCAHTDCRGFLSPAWKCLVCERHTCAECGAAKRDGHVCDEDERRTFQLIRHDCHKCPGCAQFIFRVEGCDQMWCTGCHTAFSWRTGQRLDEQHIHNPHYYEFLRTRGPLARELGDVPCGGLPTLHEVHNTFVHAPSSQRKAVSVAHRLVVHMSHIELLRYNVPPTTEQTNLDLRIRYVLNEIDDLTFRRKLQQREKQRAKRTEIHLVVRMFVDTMSDLLRRAVLERNAFVDEIDALVDYFNASMQRIAALYTCVVLKIASNGQVRRG